MRPLATAKHLLASWNPIAQRFFILVMAAVVWAWFTPDLVRERRREIWQAHQCRDPDAG